MHLPDSVKRLNTLSACQSLMIQSVATFTLCSAPYLIAKLILICVRGSVHVDPGYTVTCTALQGPTPATHL